MRWLRWTRDDPDHTSTSAEIRLADTAVDAVRPARSRNASTVLVAADSDADGLDAVAWAAAEASARQASLHILHVRRSEPFSSTCVWPGDTGVHDTAERFRSVTRQVTAWSHRPVTVVGLTDPPLHGPSAGRVIAVTHPDQDSFAAHAALGAAVNAAHRRGVGVTVLADSPRDAATSSPSESTIENLLRLHRQVFFDVDARPGIGRLLETIPPPIKFVRNRGSRTSRPDGRR